MIEEGGPRDLMTLIFQGVDVLYLMLSIAGLAVCVAQREASRRTALLIPGFGIEIGLGALRFASRYFLRTGFLSSGMFFSALAVVGLVGKGLIVAGVALMLSDAARSRERPLPRGDRDDRLDRPQQPWRPSQGGSHDVQR